MNFIRVIVSGLFWSIYLFLWVMTTRHTIKIIETINIAPEAIHKQLIVWLIFTTIPLATIINKKTKDK